MSHSTSTRASEFWTSPRERLTRALTISSSGSTEEAPRDAARTRVLQDKATQVRRRRRAKRDCARRFQRANGDTSESRLSSRVRDYLTPPKTIDEAEAALKNTQGGRGESEMVAVWVQAERRLARLWARRWMRAPLSARARCMSEFLAANAEIFPVAIASSRRAVVLV